MILFLARRADHVISNFLSSLDFCGSFCVFPHECHNLPNLLPDSFLSPAQLYLALFPPSWKSPSSPSPPKQAQKRPLQVTAGQQKVSSQDDRMLCSLPAALASTQHSTETKHSQLITFLTTSSFETLFLFFSLYFGCLKASHRAAAALLSLSVVLMLPIWLLFLFTSTGFTQSLDTGWSCGWLITGASLGLHLCKRENLLHLIFSLVLHHF